MSWMGSNCSNTNLDSESVCLVCGADRPARIVYPESTESKVVFSTFGVIVESTKLTFKGIGLFLKNFFTLFKKVGVVFIAAFGKIAESIKTLVNKIKSKRSGSDTADIPRRDRRTRAPMARSEFEEPWPEHNIRLDITAILEKGYVKSERAEVNSVKGYCFYKADSTSRFLRSEMLVALKMAKNK